MEKFHIDEYLAEIHSDLRTESQNTRGEDGFKSICTKVYKEISKEWQEHKQGAHHMLELQKKAIIGHDKEVAYYKDKIQTVLRGLGLTNAQCPSHYQSIEDGIYHENWGLAGISQWFGEAFRDSSSAKIIGERIYFLQNGKMVKQEQTISRERVNQLIRSLLLLTPEERLDKDFHEVYMLDGTRITIFTGNLVKKNQTAIIFRRYIVPTYSFQEQVDRHTIPGAVVPLFESMIQIGYNVVFTGAVRTAKTTFLSTWQSMEDTSLEGVLIETDPEIPLHQIMPEAPIVQMIADNHTMPSITKNLLRSDADYFVFAEARDGVALDTAVKLANKGTKRMKITFHLRDPKEFCADVADEIVKTYGGDVNLTSLTVGKSFDYILHFVQLSDKSQKRLAGIYAIEVDDKAQKVDIMPICKYDKDKDDWEFIYHMSPQKAQYGEEENKLEFFKFNQKLKNLAAYL